MNSSNKSIQKKSDPVVRNGVFLIDKPKGMTSFDVLRRFKLLGIRDVGHGGTLDPFATGLLIVFSGRALRLSEYLLKSEKTYEAVVKWGETSVSGDSTDPVTETSPVPTLSLEKLNSLAREWCEKPYLQIPPMHSAKKVDGKKLYELAREGKKIERKPVECRLSGFEFMSIDETSGVASFRVTVSSGTFIRTLAQDFSRALGTVGMLTELRRLRSGVFSIEDAIPLESLSLESHPISCEAFAQKLFPVIECDAREQDMAVRGQQVKLFESLALRLKKTSSTRCALFSNGMLIGVIESEAGSWRIAKALTLDSN